MDLMAPCIFEGRSELRNAGRVNCKTHWPFSGLRNTLLTERNRHSQLVAQHSVHEMIAAVRLIECALHLNTISAVCVCSMRRSYLPHRAMNHIAMQRKLAIIAL